MPLTDAEKRAIQNEHDNGLRKLLEEKYFAEQRRIKKEVSLHKREEKELKKEERKKNDKGENVWDALMRSCDEALSQGYKGFNDWSAEMQGALSLAVEFARAIERDPFNFIDNLTDILPFKDVVVEGVRAGKAWVWEKTVGKGLETIEKHTTLNDEQLGRVSFRATVDDNGQLRSSVSQNNKVYPQLNQLFTQGISAWAKFHGYNNVAPQGQQPVFQNEAGEKMTKEVFDNLKNDPETGLASMMSGRFKYNVHYQESDLAEPDEPAGSAPRL